MLLSATTITAQKTENNYQFYDSLTYNLYNKQKWDSLIKISPKIFSKNYDSYYFRIRYAIALFNTQKYIKSIAQFEKAKQFDSNDFVNSYLYFAYKYSGLTYFADELSESFTGEQKKQLKIKTHFIESIDISTSNYSNLDFNDNHNLNILKNGNVAEFSYRNKNNFLASAGISVKLSKSIKFYFAYNYLDFDKEQKFQDHYNVLYENANSRQSSFFTKLILYKNRFYTSVAYNLLAVRSNFKTISQIEYSGFSLKDSVYTSNDFAFNIALGYRFDYINLFADFTASGLNKHKQLITGLGFVSYPFGNKNLYLGYSFYSQTINEKDQTRRQNKTLNLEKNNISKILIGTKIFTPLWLEINIYLGRLNEYSENAYYIYNEITPISQLYSTKIIYLLNNNIKLFIKTTFTKRENYFYNYTINDENIYKQTINFNNLNILGGIKWDF
jgi:hypothetical protein